MSGETIQIPGFKIRRLIGEGGMARVYLADQESLDREVALKVMTPELVMQDQSFCERFLIEGKIIAKVHHQHIVTIHDIACTADKIYYMAMEYCPGGTLKERIHDGMPVSEALAIIRQIASALGYAHSKGFVHRDIKPGNVLFRDNDEAVLSDFGIAKTMDARTRLTQSGLAIGTPEYMSPEQATGGQLSAASDLYSLGVVLYEMLLGDKPFRGSDPVSTAMMHVQKPIPRLPSAFAGLQHIIDGLMAKDAGERFASAGDLIDEILVLESGREYEPPPDATRVLPVDTRELQTVGGVPRRTRSDRKKGRRAMLVGVGVALAGVLAAFVYLRNVEDSENARTQPETGLAEGRLNPLNTAHPRDATEGESPVQRDKIERLLSIARAHLAIGRVREPVGSNAVEAYQLVLELDPNNREAIDALRQIQASAPEE